jgi:SAM-dependent methyltransferase
MVGFTCNICGAANQCAREQLTREASTCTACGSSSRTRSLIWLLSRELFGTELVLPDFPRIKSLRGLGMTDSNEYARRLTDKFDYRNTFYDREPKFDITDPPPEELGRYDFLISSEIFEHVLPPPKRAFKNAHALLKPSGLLILTVPYSMEKSMHEHYPQIHKFGFAEVDGELVLVNRTRTGELQLFEKPVFHWSGAGKTLEMREYTERDLKRMLAESGFAGARICAENYLPYGIVYPEKWSLPMVARKGDFAFSTASAREVMEEWREVRNRAHREADRLNRSYWFRIGRKLGWY